MQLGTDRRRGDESVLTPGLQSSRGLYDNGLIRLGDAE
jgi:hypothetical protein